MTKSEVIKLCMIFDDFKDFHLGKHVQYMKMKVRENPYTLLFIDNTFFYISASMLLNFFMH